jgi:phosphomannomutase
MATSDSVSAPSSAASPAAALAEIVKAYDIRGLTATQLTPEVVRAVGIAFAEYIAGESPAVIVAHDMRDSSPLLADAVADGITAAGIDVIHIGLASTDLMYFASGSLNLPGVMFTASHNPARYNGVKFCRAGAVPMSLGAGLDTVRDRAVAILTDGDPKPADRRGAVSQRDLLPAYADKVRGMVDTSAMRPLKVVVDAGNGMAGMTAPEVLGPLPVTLVPLYFELDGTFPNHEANPLDPANLVDLQAEVLRVGADIGLAFDGDADRCFVVDERGRPVSASAITALVALRELRRAPGATVLYNLITSRAVPEMVTAAGGRPVRTRVGHSYIKAEMAATGAIFGGEHSAHYYFADFFRADTGMVAAIHVLAALGEQDGPLSELVAEYARYSQSGEINSTVADTDAVTGRLRTWAAERGATVDELDGLTITLPHGDWFNVRSSNTEPLLRLNVEAADESAMATLRDDILALIRA